MESPVTDAELVKRYREGDGHAFETLVLRYKERLFAFLYRYAGNKQAAEDLFQDVFMKVIKNIDKYNEQGKFSQWLFGVAAHQATDYYRKEKNRKKMISDTGLVYDDENMDRLEKATAEMTVDPERQFFGKEQVKIVLTAVQKLPSEQKLVFTLRENGGMTFREIAELTSTPLNTVLARMRYALKFIRKSVSFHYNGENYAK